MDDDFDALLSERSTTTATSRPLGQQGFLRLVDLEVKRAHRYDRSLSVALVAVDGLRNLGDTAGAGVAREVLDVITRATRDLSRDSDVIGILGPALIGFLMPETTARNAASMVERLRTAISAAPICTSAGNWPCGLSVGIAAKSARTRNAETFLMSASMEMRRAQSRGGNAVCVHPGDVVCITVPRSGSIH